MSTYLHKNHNVSMLMYHFVCTAKYRKVVLTEPVDLLLKQICLAIGDRYEIHFIEIGTDRDHVHFLVQSVPTMPPQRIVQTVKSITAKEIFKRMPDVKMKLWGGEFWTDGYYVNTVALYGSENAVREYIKSQGKSREYRHLHRNSPTLFDH
ncbi:MAG: IS200/IS605 family transposase [Patescibacteria group bacterium]|nr:IS200/IS605 family transposase [Patescibacteria group bacterium]